MKFVLILLALFAVASAFSPVKNFARVSMKPRVKALADAGPTYWEGKAPPSRVLGLGEKIPSAVFGPLSLVAFVVGTYCAHESNILHPISPDAINPAYVAGTFLVPVSWGMHVAAWIQKQNGK